MFGALLAVVACLSGCADPTAATQIMLVIDSDWAALERVRVEFGHFASPPVDIALVDDPLPSTLALAHAGGPIGPIGVRVSGYLTGSSAGSQEAAIVEPRTDIYFVPNETRMLRISLSAACAGSCAITEACLIDRRAQATCHAASAVGVLEPWTGVLDGGRPAPIIQVDPMTLADGGALPTLMGNPSEGPLDGAGRGEQAGATGGPGEADPLGSAAAGDAGCTGACAMADPPDAGSEPCTGDTCPTVCAPGWGDCDGDAGNGCETELAQHCGPCGERTGYEKLLAVPAGTVAEPLPGFPLLVSLEDDDLVKGLASGLDLCFAGLEGATPLPFEIEHWNQATGSLRAWVRVESLEPDQEQVLRLYYGDGQAVDRAAPVAVWDDDYLAVLHLADTSDAKRGLAGTGKGYRPVPGLVGGAMAFDPATGGFLDLAVSDLESGLFVEGATIEAWVFAEGWGQESIGAIMGSTADASGQRWALMMGDSALGARTFTFGMSNDAETGSLLPLILPAGLLGGLVAPGAEVWTAPANTARLGRWHHVAIAYDANWLLLPPRVYVDGLAVSVTHSGAGVVADAGGLHLRIGNVAAGDHTFDGIIDEVRVSRGLRSAEWLAAGVRSQRDGAAFLTVGAETIAPAQ